MSSGDRIYRDQELRLMTRVLMEYCHGHGIAPGSADAEVIASLIVSFHGKGIRTAEQLHEALRPWPGGRPRRNGRPAPRSLAGHRR
jgi:hypothetical protein